MMKSMMSLLVFCGALLGVAVPLASGADRPNVVWLTTEDNSANWYRLYNPEHGAPMPNVERLAKEGLVFNNAYSCGAVCSVARSTIISGCYAPRTGSQYHRNQIPVAMPDGLKMFPYYLRQAGYYTANNRKKDYNYLPSDQEGVWNESSGKASFRKRKPGQPFFYVQNFGRTHESQLFGDLPKGSTYVVDPADVELFPYHPDTLLFREKYAQYLTLNAMADAEMGAVIKQLEDDGLMDDTFIFHYGDHGGVLPGGKGYAHDDGLHPAMVVYVPKNWKHLVPAPRGSRIDGFVEFVDLSATVLNLAGIEIPEGIDGKAFLGKGVSLKELNQRDTAFGYAERFDEKYDMVRFLRKGKFSYWRSYQPFNFDGLFNYYRYKQPAFREWRDLAEAGKLNADQAAFYQARQPEQLYDLEKDPHEIHNLADDPAYADMLVRLRRELQEREKSMPDVGFFPESKFLAESDGNGAAFGLKNKARISKLIDIADLQLNPFPEARARIEKALRSSDAMERYWGAITCSAFGSQALVFEADLKRLAADDPDRLVQTRAAEFLGLTGAADPAPYLFATLAECDDPIEVNLILNSVVLLKDAAGVEFDMSKAEGAAWTKMGGLVPHRVNYLQGGTGDVRKRKKK
jgi:arylsulfatase A-like enzyme